MCRYWLSQRFALSADDLARLLRSDEGMTFLEAAMGDARPAWWADFKLQLERADINRRQRELRRQIERLEQGSS
jgi:AraC-like DNA-binding protein